jgi:hypothetical protein
MKNNQAENPSEKKNFSEEFIKISEHARAEISWVRSAYKFAFGFIITGVTVLLGLGIYFTYQNTHDLKADMQKDADAMRTSLHTDFDTLKQQQQQDLASYLTQMHGEVAKHIDAEFASSNIVNLVHDQAKERIDVIADTLIQTDITNRIAPIRTELLALLSTNIDDEKNRIADINKTANESLKTETNLQAILTEAKDTLKQLDEQSDFFMTVLAAESDDRNAFEKLCKLASDVNYNLHDQALKVTSEIPLKYVGFESETERGYQTIGWLDSLKPNTFDMNQIEQAWKQMSPQLSRAYVDFVWGHTNITRNQKLIFLHGVLNDSHGSLKSEDKAAHILADELKANYNPPFVFSDIEQKWNDWTKTNQPSITATNVLNPK